MLTTRSGHRLIQRFDNADERLLPDAKQLGLLSKEQIEVFEEKQSAIR